LPVRKPTVVEVANEKVSIVTVCQMLGLELPDDIGSSRDRKVHCPFGQLYHSDSGRDPAMRIYIETNNAYCFSCAMNFTPVSLAATAMDCTRRAAAVRLLDRIGYRLPDPGELWQQARSYVPPPDKAMLADALKTYCGRIDPSWRSRQFEPWVAHRLTRCLSLLELVSTDEDVALWLTGCKEAMRRVLPTRGVSISGMDEVAFEVHDE
jgi:hypothetical protein